MDAASSRDDVGELAWVRIELELLASPDPLPVAKRLRFEELTRRERALLRLDEPTA